MAILTYRNGNLIDAFLSEEIDVLAHQANCFCTMGAGIAREIKQRLPAAWEADRKTIRGDISKLGGYSVASIDDGQHFVFNLYGQYKYGRGDDGAQNTNIPALKSALLGMSSALMTLQPRDWTVGIPKLGCGLGGANWADVEAMLLALPSPHHFFVYEL